MSFSKEEKGKGRATPQTNDAVIPAPATSSSIVSRAAASAWGLTQNVFTKPAEALLESSSTMPYGGTEKGQFHNVGSSRGDIGPSLPLSVLEASRQKTTQLDNLSFRTQDLEPSYKSPEVEMEEEAFLAPPPLPERKRKSHFWIDDYNRLKHTWNPNEEDGAEVVSLLSDPSFSPLDESLYLPNSETKPDIPPDLFTRDIPPHALSILEGLKRLLPPPPIHQPASVFDLLSLCSSASPLTRSGEFSDGASQWSDVDLNSAGSVCHPLAIPTLSLSDSWPFLSDTNTQSN